MIIWILGLASIAAVFFLWLLPWQRKDNWKSGLQRLHLPPAEVNKAANGKDGYFSLPHAIRNDIIIDGGMLAGGVVLQFFWVGGLFIVAGFFGLYGWLIKDKIRKDLETLEADLSGQEKTLAALKINPDAYLPDPQLRAYPGKGHVFVCGTFYDLHEETDIPTGVQFVPLEEVARAAAAIRPRLVALAQKAPSEWRKANRAEGL